MSNYNTFLTTLNTVAEKNAFEVYIPSLARNVKFKPVTAKQQKNFYSCIQDNVLFETKFIIVTYNIIKENCLEPDLVNKFNVIDRICILLNFRKNILGTEITIIKDDVPYDLNFAECIERAQATIIPVNKVINVQNIQIELGVPSIEDQYNIEVETRSGKNLNNLTYNEAIIELITNEVCKTIRSITLLEQEQPLKINFSELTFEQKNALADKLPAEVFVELQKFIKEINNSYDGLLRVKTEDGKELSFNIGPDFFLSE